MPKSVFIINVTWQAVAAIEDFLQDKDEANLVIPDPEIRSRWISFTSRNIAGNFKIEIKQTAHALLLNQLFKYLEIENRLPDTRDDLLFNILHHPAFDLDPFVLGELSINFFRNKKEKSFRRFLQNPTHSLDIQKFQAQNVVQKIQEWKSMEEATVREEFCEHLLSNTRNELHKRILKILKNDTDGKIQFHSDQGQLHLASHSKEITTAKPTLICDLEGSFNSADLLEADVVLSTSKPNSLKDFRVKSTQPNIQLLPDEWIDKALSKYHLSVSHLNKLLRCPLSFYFETVLRAPHSKHPAMAFGSAVHYALEKSFRKMLRHQDKVFPQRTEIVALFEKSMAHHQAFFEQKDYSIRLEYGKQIIHRHFDDFEEDWNRIATIERRIRTNIEGIPVHGFIDKIEFDYHRATIVDYKTGTFEDKMYRFAPPGEAGTDYPFEHAFGGNYWRQAVFYHLLITHDHSTRWRPHKVVFEYLEPEKKTNKILELKPTEEEQETVKEQIRRAYQIIEDRAFDRGCGEADCRWCRFVSENNYPTADLRS